MQSNAKTPESAPPTSSTFTFLNAILKEIFIRQGNVNAAFKNGRFDESVSEDFQIEAKRFFEDEEPSDFEGYNLVHMVFGLLPSLENQPEINFAKILLKKIIDHKSFDANQRMGDEQNRYVFSGVNFLWLWIWMWINSKYKPSPSFFSEQIPILLNLISHIIFHKNLKPDLTIAPINKTPTTDGSILWWLVYASIAQHESKDGPILSKMVLHALRTYPEKALGLNYAPSQSQFRGQTVAWLLARHNKNVDYLQCLQELHHKGYKIDLSATPPPPNDWASVGYFLRSYDELMHPSDIKAVNESMQTPRPHKTESKILRILEQMKQVAVSMHKTTSAKTSQKEKTQSVPANKTVPATVAPEKQPEAQNKAAPEKTAEKEKTKSSTPQTQRVSKRKAARQKKFAAVSPSEKKTTKQKHRLPIATLWTQSVPCLMLQKLEEKKVEVDQKKSRAAERELEKKIERLKRNMQSKKNHAKNRAPFSHFTDPNICLTLFSARTIFTAHSSTPPSVDSCVDTKHSTPSVT